MSAEVSKAPVNSSSLVLNNHSWSRAFQLGLRNLWRDLRSGELNLLIVSVVLAVAALTAVGFFSDRLQAGLWRDARQLLGGDAVVVSDKPTAENFQKKAQPMPA
jgi:putative ABC transport system permease protein